MITFKQYLAEAKPAKNIKKPPTVQKLDAKKVLARLKDQAPIALKCIAEGKMLWRGSDQVGNFMLVDASQSTRRSRDTNNIYQLLLNASTAMKDYPSRSSSLICSTDYWEAYKYGDQTYVVFPEMGTKVAVANADDFIKHVMTAEPLVYKEDLEDIGLNIHLILKHFKCNRPKFYETPAELQACLSKAMADLPAFSLRWAQTFHGMIFSEHVEEFFKKNKGHELQALASLIATPEHLKTNLLTVNQTFAKQLASHDNCEAWFSGKCLMINVWTFKRILAQMVREGMPVHHELAREMHIDELDDEDAYLFPKGYDL